MAETVLTNLVTVKNALKSFGLQVSVCEDPTELLNEINEIVKQYEEETSDKIERLLEKLDFKTLVFVAANILASTLGGLVSSWYQKVVENFINGKIMGSYLSLVSFIASAVPGAVLFFKYVATDSLQINLRYRVELMRLLKVDLDLLSNILLDYLTLFKNAKYPPSELEPAIKELTLALKKLNRNINEVNNNSTSIISKDVLKEVNNHIDKCIQYLSLDGSTTANLILDKIHNKYNLKTKPPTLEQQLSLSYWFKYFEDLNNEIFNSFYGEEGERMARYIARELFPFFPRFLQLMLLQSQINEATLNLQLKTPTLLGINGGSISGLSKFAGNQIESVYNSMLKFFGYETPRPTTTPLFYTNDETKDLTLQKLNSRVKLFEYNILSLDNLYDFIKLAGDPYLNLAEDVTNQLKVVRDDMVNFQKNSELKKLPDDYKLIAKKPGWLTKLKIAQGTLAATLSDYSGFQVPLTGPLNRSIDGLDIAELLKASEDSFVKLQNYIANKRKDEDGNPIKEPIESGLLLSQSALLKLIGNISLIAVPSWAVDLIAELKSISFSYEKQINMDLLEISRCNSYISILDGSRVFLDIKIAMQYYIDNLGKISTFTEIANDLLNGNLMTLAEGAGDVGTIINDVAECFDVAPVKFLTDLKNSLDAKSKDRLNAIYNVEATVVKIMAELNNFTKIINYTADLIKEGEKATHTLIEKEFKHDDAVVEQFIKFELPL